METTGATRPPDTHPEVSWSMGSGWPSDDGGRWSTARHAFTVDPLGDAGRAAPDSDARHDRWLDRDAGAPNRWSYRDRYDDPRRGADAYDTGPRGRHRGDGDRPRSGDAAGTGGWLDGTGGGRFNPTEPSPVWGPVDQPRLSPSGGWAMLDRYPAPRHGSGDVLGRHTADPLLDRPGTGGGWSDPPTGWGAADAGHPDDHAPHQSGGYDPLTAGWTGEIPPVARPEDVTAAQFAAAEAETSQFSIQPLPTTGPAPVPGLAAGALLSAPPAETARSPLVDPVEEWDLDATGPRGVHRRALHAAVDAPPTILDEDVDPFGEEQASHGAIAAPPAGRGGRRGAMKRRTTSRRAKNGRSPRPAGRRRGRSSDRRLWIALGALVAAAVAAIAVIVASAFPGGPAGPPHRLVTPSRLDRFVRQPALERQTEASQLRQDVVRMTSGQATHIVEAVYEQGTAATGKTPQILMFIGGNLANASPATSIAGFTQRFGSTTLTSPGRLGGKAACVNTAAEQQDGSATAAMCAWFDNDTFGVLVSPTMTATTLAQTMRAVRPQLEVVVTTK